MSQAWKELTSPEPSFSKSGWWDHIRGEVLEGAGCPKAQLFGPSSPDTRSKAAFQASPGPTSTCLQPCDSLSDSLLAEAIQAVPGLVSLCSGGISYVAIADRTHKAEPR